MPRTRLEAEIRFLPGVTYERAVSTLAALRAGEMPDLRHLPFLARANVLAHLASAGKGDCATLRELSELQPRLTRDIVLDLITADRAAAGAPKLNGALLDDALAALGALREYKWRIERESVRDLRLRGSLWIAFVTKPHDDVITFLEDEEVLVSWQQRNRAVELTDRSKQRWYQYLGVR